MAPFSNVNWIDKVIDEATKNKQNPVALAQNIASLSLLKGTVVELQEEIDMGAKTSKPGLDYQVKALCAGLNSSRRKINSILANKDKVFTEDMESNVQNAKTIRKFLIDSNLNDYVASCCPLSEDEYDDKMAIGNKMFSSLNSYEPDDELSDSTIDTEIRAGRLNNAIRLLGTMSRNTNEINETEMYNAYLKRFEQEQAAALSNLIIVATQANLGTVAGRASMRNQIRALSEDTIGNMLAAIAKHINKTTETNAELDTFEQAHGGFQMSLREKISSMSTNLFNSTVANVTTAVSNRVVSGVLSIVKVAGGTAALARTTTEGVGGAAEAFIRGSRAILISIPRTVVNLIGSVFNSASTLTEVIVDFLDAIMPVLVVIGLYVLFGVFLAGIGSFLFNIVETFFTEKVIPWFMLQFSLMFNI